MKIAVCIKQVPVVSLLKFDSETRRVVRQGVPSEVNLFDVLGVSAAAELRQALSCEVVVFTMGPPQARDALVQCLAMGADRAVHLVDPAFAGSDTLATARALSMALRRERFDLIICGRNSVDAETGQVGPEIAELLDLPQITGVSRLEVSDAGTGITVERLTDEGHEVLYCKLPALITVTEGVAPEAYPDNDAIEAARRKPLIELAAADLSADSSVFGLEGSPTRVNEIYVMEPSRERILVRDKPAEESVQLLLDYLEQRELLGGRKKPHAVPRPRGAKRTPARDDGLWVLSEIMGGEVRPVTLELLGRAVELAPQIDAPVEAVVIGDGVERHTATLGAYGANRVHVASHPDLVRYDTGLYTGVLAAAIETRRPYALLIPSTANGRDLASRLAARLGLGLTGDCIGLEIDGEGMLVQLKPAFGGNVVAPILSKTIPQMATVRPGMMTPVEPDWSVRPEIADLPVDTIGAPMVRLLESVVDASAEGAELEHADTIVTVGAGVGGPESIEVVRELAHALGAPLGATRDVADLGWLPRQCQIGLSGKSVSPDLYIAVAVRGPLNHTVGIQKAGTVVAINNSVRAPIFRAADFGIVGDYAEVVPALTRALADRRATTAQA